MTDGGDWPFYRSLIEKDNWGISPISYRDFWLYNLKKDFIEDSKMRYVRIQCDETNFIEGPVIQEDSEVIIIQDEMYGECRMSKPVPIQELYEE